MLVVLSIFFFCGKKVWHFFMALSLWVDDGRQGNGNLYKYTCREGLLPLCLSGATDL